MFIILLLSIIIIPNNKNQCVPTLYTLTKNRMKLRLIHFIKSSACESNHLVHTVRKYIRHHLPGVILADLLTMMLPSQDKWLFSCTTTTTTRLKSTITATTWTSTITTTTTTTMSTTTTKATYHLLEDDLRWKTSFGGKWHSVEDDARLWMDIIIFILRMESCRSNR